MARNHINNMTDNRTSIEIAKEIAALALKHREATVSVPVGVEYQKPKHFFVGLTILIDLAASNSQPPKLDGSPQYAVCNQKTRDKCIENYLAFSQRESKQ